MSFYDALEGSLALLRQHGRVSARALKRQFGLDDDAYADLKAELVDVLRAAREDDAGVLVWTGAAASAPAPAAAPRAPAAGVEAERRFLTVLFCDLVDATPLSERLDPEQLGEVYQAWQDACIDVIAALGGHVAEYRGDGAFIYFGYPSAQEDAPQRAIRTAFGIVERLGELNRTLSHSHGVTLAVRIGVHSGLVLLSNLGGGYVRDQFAVGETPNVAARVQALAGPGEVLVSDAAHAIARADFDFDDLGERALKGLSKPVRVWRALRARARTRDDAKHAPIGLVGREPELALLRERWALAMEGHGRAVLITGEAGIGKSRLVREHRAHAEARGAQRVVFRCSPYHGATALHPVVAHLERLLRFAPGDSTGERLMRLRAQLEAVGLDAAAHVPLFAPLLALDGAAPGGDVLTPLAARERRAQTIDALVRWILAAARQRALLLVCEDLHWADPTTVELLGQLIDQIAHEQLLVILTCRPDFRAPWPQRSHMSQIALARLSDADAMAFAASALHGRLLDGAALARVVERADGVPLFIEELVHTLADHADAAAAGAELPIPDTLQGSLMARLDRQADLREIAQVAAAAGREFSYPLLRAIAPCGEAELQDALRRLVDAELLQRRGTPPEAVYRFRHALIRDAAYESTLKSRRAVYHQRIADALQAHFAPLVEAQPELLARHLAEAGERARAVELLRVAGERALNRCANEEALAHLGRALALLAQLPPSSVHARLGLRLEVARGAALMMARGQSSPEVEQAYGNARRLTQQAGDSADVFPALMGLWRFYGAQGRMPEAREVAEQMYAVASASGHPASLLGARMALGMTLFHLWELPRARVLVQEGVDQYLGAPPDDREIEMFSLGQHPGMACAMCLAFITLLTGDEAASARWQADAIAIARRLDSPFQLTSMLGWSAVIHEMRGNDAGFRADTQAAAQLAEQHRFPAWAAVMRVYRGLIELNDGAHAAGLAQMASGLAQMDEIRLWLMRPRCLLVLARANLVAGRPDDALDALRLAEADFASGAESWWEPELHALRAQALRARGDAAGALACWRESLAVAQRRGLPFFEHRATAALTDFS
jgi:class 3 adenylate cyclase